MATHKPTRTSRLASTHHHYMPTLMCRHMMTRHQHGHKHVYTHVQSRVHKPSRSCRSCLGVASGAICARTRCCSVCARVRSCGRAYVCVRACVRAYVCLRACVRVCACVRACLFLQYVRGWAHGCVRSWVRWCVCARAHAQSAWCQGVPTGSLFGRVAVAVKGVRVNETTCA